MEDEDGYMSIDPTTRPHNHKPKGPPPPPPPSLLWWKISVGILLAGIVGLTLLVIFLSLPVPRHSFEEKNAGNVIQSCQRRCAPCSLAKSNSIIANLTLNPATNNPHLYISDCLKIVSWKGRMQDLKSGPLRYDRLPSVLSQEGFKAGIICWEVEVVNGGTWWGVGVVRESANRNGPIVLDPSGGYWGVQHIDGQYQSITTPRTNLSLCHHPTRIRVSLDYWGGQVSFFDGDTDAELFSFPKTNFGGEKLLGWFLINEWNGELRVYP